MILHDKKCIFIHVVRTGGSSIERLWHGDDWWRSPDGPETKHLTAARAREVYCRWWDAYFKFAFVRNPWDWLVSQFVRETTTSENRRPPIDEFRAQIQRADRLGLSAAKFYDVDLQSEIVGEGLDFIGRYETLAHDFEEVCRRVGARTCRLPHFGRGKRAHYSVFYDEESVEIVRRRYAVDIERFGYEFDRSRPRAWSRPFLRLFDREAVTDVERSSP